MFSVSHMVVLFIVVLVVFGPHKLPELARGLGKLMAEFRKASTDFKLAFEEEMRNIERQAREAERKKQMEEAAASATTSESSTAGELPAPAPEAISESASAPAEPVIAPVAESVARENGQDTSTEPLDASHQESSSGATLQEKALHEPLQDHSHSA